MRKFVHIGLGKAASTTLQKYVYPVLARSQAIAYIDPETVSRLINGAEDKSVLQGNFLASSESLVGVNPKDWDACHELNLSLFGQNTTILLILKRPSSYMRSIFQQVSHHTGILIEPNDYFMSAAEDHTPNRPYTVFDAQEFDQERLVQLYANTFDQVIVQKLETISDMMFLCCVFDMAEKEKNAVQAAMSRNKSNRSFSQTAVNISMKLKWMFGQGASARPGEKTVRTLRYRIWRDFIQGVFDPLYPYKKYVLDWKQVPSVDVVAMDAAYDRMPAVQHFINGIAKTSEK